MEGYAQPAMRDYAEPASSKSSSNGPDPLSLSVAKADDGSAFQATSKSLGQIANGAGVFNVQFSSQAIR